MKGHYEGRAPGAEDGGERVLLWATVVKNVDRSNQVVHCAGEVFTPAAEAMAAAEPTAEELKAALVAMAAWEQAEVVRKQKEEERATAEAAQATAAAAAKGAVPTAVAATVTVSAVSPEVLEQLKSVVSHGLA